MWGCVPAAGVLQQLGSRCVALLAYNAIGDFNVSLARPSSHRTARRRSFGNEEPTGPFPFLANGRPLCLVHFQGGGGKEAAASRFARVASPV